MSNFVMSIKITDSITDTPQEVSVCRQSNHGGTFVNYKNNLLSIKLIYIGGVPEFF